MRHPPSVTRGKDSRRPDAACRTAQRNGVIQPLHDAVHASGSDIPRAGFRTAGKGALKRTSAEGDADAHIFSQGTSNLCFKTQRIDSSPRAQVHCARRAARPSLAFWAVRSLEPFDRRHHVCPNSYLGMGFTTKFIFALFSCVEIKLIYAQIHWCPLLRHDLLATNAYSQL